LRRDVDEASCLGGARGPGRGNRTVHAVRASFAIHYVWIARAEADGLGVFGGDSASEQQAEYGLDRE